MKLAGKFDTIISTPPPEQWTDLTLASAAAIQAVHGIRMPNLRTLIISVNQALVTLNASGLPALVTIHGPNCFTLADVRAAHCPGLKTVTLVNAALPTPNVDRLLADLVANGTADGAITVAGGSSGPPSDPDGIASKLILISRGWTVSTN